MGVNLISALWEFADAIFFFIVPDLVVERPLFTCLEIFLFSSATKADP